MPQGKQSASTDATGDAQGRFTVQLPADVRPMLQALGRDVAEKVKASHGMELEPSMAQVVAGIVKAQHEVMLTRQAQHKADKLLAETVPEAA